MPAIREAIKHQWKKLTVKKGPNYTRLGIIFCPPPLEGSSSWEKYTNSGLLAGRSGRILSLSSSVEWERKTIKRDSTKLIHIYAETGSKLLLDARNDKFPKSSYSALVIKRSFTSWSETGLFAWGEGAGRIYRFGISLSVLRSPLSPAAAILYILPSHVLRAQTTHTALNMLIMPSSLMKDNTRTYIWMNTTALSACAVCHWLLLLESQHNVKCIFRQRKHNQNVYMCSRRGGFQPAKIINSRFMSEWLFTAKHMTVNFVCIEQIFSL